MFIWVLKSIEFHLKHYEITQRSARYLRMAVIFAGIAQRPASIWISSTLGPIPAQAPGFPAPTSWTHEALSKASELCILGLETNFLVDAVDPTADAGPAWLTVLGFESCMGQVIQGLHYFIWSTLFVCFCHWQLLCSLPYVKWFFLDDWHSQGASLVLSLTLLQLCYIFVS